MARVLDALNSEALRECGAAFGGGTLISLTHAEFRLSKDIDFVCPVGPGYRKLRQLVAELGPDGLVRTGAGVTVPRGFRADQYGVRMAVEVEGDLIKFEVFAEARVKLEPRERMPWTSVDCLSEIDQFAEKLLANADRWADDSVNARDLIDLCMLRRSQPMPSLSVEKANAAYPVLEPLQRAIEAFQRRTAFRQQCFERLEIQEDAVGQIMEGLDLLAADAKRA